MRELHVERIAVGYKNIFYDLLETSGKDHTDILVYLPNSVKRKFSVYVWMDTIFHSINLKRNQLPYCRFATRADRYINLIKF